MSIGLYDIDSNLCFYYVVVWFGLVRLVKWKPQTKPNHAVE